MTKQTKDLLTQSLGPAASRRDVLDPIGATASLDTLLSSLADPRGETSGPGASQNVEQQAANLSKQLNDLRTAEQTQIETLKENTQATVQNTSSKSSGSSVAGAIGDVATSFLGAGFGLAPIISGILGLFGGSDSKETPAPLVKFSLPPAVQFQGGVSDSSPGQVSPVDYGQGGSVRPIASNNTQTPMVQINVNAMDSRSFLDHSDDIARAVREAMLNSSSLNDVIADL